MRSWSSSTPQTTGDPVITHHQCPGHAGDGRIADDGRTTEPIWDAHRGSRRTTNRRRVVGRVQHPAVVREIRAGDHQRGASISVQPSSNLETSFLDGRSTISGASRGGPPDLAERATARRSDPGRAVRTLFDFRIVWRRSGTRASMPLRVDATTSATGRCTPISHNSRPIRNRST